MAGNLPLGETRDAGPRAWRYLLPMGTLIVMVAIVCGLMMSGIVVGDREAAGGAPITTTPTVEIAP